MSDMTLLEALQTDEVKGVLSTMVEDALKEALPIVIGGDTLKETLFEAVTSVVEAQLPTLRESVRQDISKEQNFDVLHRDAKSLIEAARGLTPAARKALLEDYSLVESGDSAVPGRSLALVEAAVDEEGKITKSAKAVLRESVESDVERFRGVLREAAPSLPRSPGVPGEAGNEQTVSFLGEDSAFSQRLKEKGMSPSQFGASIPNNAA